ncbi:MAG: HAD-IB family phosphatase [Myxococcales bacterium]|nr:HAD-IB family phosphatase [Myxococcales bacterium]
MSQPGWLKPFPAAFRRVATALLRPRDGRRVACFDADGTLWTEDIGESFLRWLLAGPLEHLVAADPRVYEKYEARVRRSLTDGYGWAVQLMAGLREADVVRWARQHAAAWPNYRPAMLELLRGLAAAGVEVWLVSASNHWVVAATGMRIGLPFERTIGVRTEVENGILTDRIVPPMPCEGGKVEAIDRFIGRRPDLAVGDGLGDLAMLEVAAARLCVGLRTRRDAPLLRVARERGWPIHLF